MLIVSCDLSQLRRLGDNLEPVLRQAADKAAQMLVPATHAHMMELAAQRLHSRLEKFTKGVKIVQESEDTWLITLNKTATWIDDGMPEHSMVDDLLKRGAKTAKDGSRYRSIPFDHSPGKGPATSTPAQQSLQATIKAELKKRDIPYAKVERNPDGSPKLGKLHALDINNGPLKTANGPGQGWGKIGQPKQGPTGTPFLQGIRIYQREVKNAAGKVSVKRAIMTFRTVSSKHKAQNRWVHPGLKPQNIFEDTAKWAREEWETNVMPKIVDFVLDNV